MPGIGGWDIAIIVFIVIAVVILTMFLLNRWASRRLVEQKTMIERNKQAASIYVIDKKKDRLKNANFPKAVHEQVPRWNKLMRMYLVKAKIGPQIMTLMCDKEVFNALPLKKTVKVDLAGIYIVSMKGMKTKQEMAALKTGGGLPWYRRLIGR
jgi:hypothetical protein